MADILRDIVDRLRGVCIEHDGAMAAMARYDEPDALHHVDPPYVAATRDPGGDYAHEMTDADHAELLAFLRNLRGRVILTGYAHPLYDDALSDWRRVERRALADGARDGGIIRSCGSVWEPACGGEALVREIRAFGLPCVASDLVDRGCSDSNVADFFGCEISRGRASSLIRPST